MDRQYTAEKTRILLIGTLPPPIGGISVSFKILVGLLQEKECVIADVVNLAAIRENGRKKILRYFAFVNELINGIKKADVVTLYVASTALPSLALIVLLLSQINRKPFILRKAAGYDYMDLGGLKARLAHYVVEHSTLFLAQTRNLVELTEQRGVRHVRWYPTSRIMGDEHHADTDEKAVTRRFVFIGQVRAYKGIMEIIAAAERFCEPIVVDIYGPIFDDISTEAFKQVRNVRYCGVLTPENVIGTMKNYDVLLLPTKALTEGYPGAVFEGYAAGLPIITTRCGGIPEIVDESCGIFVEPGSAESLYRAMRKVVDENDEYIRLKNAVIEKRKEFDAAIWADKFVEYCWEVKKK